MKICGPKLSGCCFLLSIWGIVQLLVMGICFYTRSVALIEDVGAAEHGESGPSFMSDVYAGYEQNAYNCWIATLMYLVTMVVSGQQFYVNRRGYQTF